VKEVFTPEKGEYLIKDCPHGRSPLVFEVSLVCRRVHFGCSVSLDCERSVHAREGRVHHQKLSSWTVTLSVEVSLLSWRLGNNKKKVIGACSPTDDNDQEEQRRDRQRRPHNERRRRAGRRDKMAEDRPAPAPPPPLPCPPHRCFLSEVSGAVLGPSRRRSLRLLGTVVHVQQQSAEDAEEDEQETSAAKSGAGGAGGGGEDGGDNHDRLDPGPRIVLDDGSGVLVSLVAPPHVLDHPSVAVAVGMTVECIALVVQEKAEGEERLVIDQLFWITDPHAEVLRWAQIAHQRRGALGESAAAAAPPPVAGASGCRDGGGGGGDGGFRHGLGYPVFPVTAEDVFDIIQSEADPTEEEHDDTRSLGSNALHGKQTQEKRTPSRRPGGFGTPSRKALPAQAPPVLGYSAAELSKLLDLPVRELEPMIEELQLSARIYQDDTGRYLPL
jgi:hypothetical protein